MTKTEGVKTYLSGLRVLEIADELGEYAGKFLAGLGADVVKIEPPGGEKTRSYGPFRDDIEDPNGSLYFWHYNSGKRGIALDLDHAAGRERFRSLAAVADVVIDTRHRDYLDERGIGYEDLRRSNPRLIYSRISPFGDTGPWADWHGSDLVHLALGGVVMNCGYDPDPFDRYDTPPVAPQMWQAYQIAGDLTVISILGALAYRLRCGKGQQLSTSVHDAVSKNTETDVPNWIFLRQIHGRLTCRHSVKTIAGVGQLLAPTKDGRYLLPYRTYLKGVVGPWEGTVALLKKYGMEQDLESERYDDVEYRHSTESLEHIGRLTDQLTQRTLFADDLWKEASALALPWAPVRRPEENTADAHWWKRGAFVEIEHPELGQSFTYTGSKWYSRNVEWRNGPRAPLVDEHTAEVLLEWATAAPQPALIATNPRVDHPAIVSERGKPFAISDLRVIDLSWMLASAGAGRYLTALGAEVIKVEHDSRLDGMRFSQGQCPPGGRAERERATEALPTPVPDSPNRGGSFIDINSGKLSLALNLKNSEAKAILEDLIRDADVVLEGFSPGTMDRMGLGYERLKELNPSIIYVQQSGFGQYGDYGTARAYGPTAQALTGISELSGLPEPFPPAGIGYSYLDWFGAYNMAAAVLAALYRRDTTGEGCYIDASQGEAGLYLVGSTILDHAVNGRRWSRYGNRSPYKRAAPHGIYRLEGADRWIAIAAFTEEHWRAVAGVLGHPEWLDDPRFRRLADRLSHQDELDALIDQTTQGWADFALTDALQAAGVPAGVAQNAQDRVENDPQLAHLGWLVELNQTDIGRWPVKELPVQLSESPAYIGGRYNRSGPSYGEDTDWVLGRFLDKSTEEIERLREGGALERPAFRRAQSQPAPLEHQEA